MSFRRGDTLNSTLVFLVDNHLFCGDALFSAGCGRVFTGNYALMFEGLQRLNTLPDETIVCPAHEYTLGNLAFAETVLVDKSAVEKKCGRKKCGRKNNVFLLKHNGLKINRVCQQP